MYSSDMIREGERGARNDKIFCYFAGIITGISITLVVIYLFWGLKMTQEEFFKTSFPLTLTGQEISNLIYFIRAGRNAGLYEYMSAKEFESCLVMKENLDELLNKLYKEHVVEKKDIST